MAKLFVFKNTKSYSDSDNLTIMPSGEEPIAEIELNDLPETDQLAVKHALQDDTKLNQLLNKVGKQLPNVPKK